MTRWILTLFFLFLAAAPSFAQGDEPRGSGLLICYPNAPGTQRQAQPVMEQLGRYLETKLAAPCAPSYFNEIEGAKRWLETHRPRFAILSLAVYLRWREEHGLTVVALSERQGKAEQQFYLLVAKGSPLKTLEDLAKQQRPTHVWSAHLDDERFATNVIFQGRVRAHSGGSGKVRVASTQQPLRALRRLKEGQTFNDLPVDAVLVDSVTWTGLQRLKTFRGVLRVLYTCPALPTPPVVAFSGVAPERMDKLRNVLGNMQSDQEGMRVLKTLQVTGFVTPPENCMDAAVAAYEQEVGE